MLHSFLPFCKPVAVGSGVRLESWNFVERWVGLKKHRCQEECVSPTVEITAVTTIASTAVTGWGTAWQTEEDASANLGISSVGKDAMTLVKKCFCMFIQVSTNRFTEFSSQVLDSMDTGAKPYVLGVSVVEISGPNNSCNLQNSGLTLFFELSLSNTPCEGLEMNGTFDIIPIYSIDYL